MSLDNIVVIVRSLSQETNKLSENEEVSLYIYLTGENTKLAVVERLLKLCKTNSAKLKYLRGISKNSVCGALLLLLTVIIFANNLPIIPNTYFLILCFLLLLLNRLKNTPSESVPG